MHRKKKNEKLDIYTVLMLPLMTMFLLNIGLIATTWAWYTASVSTGVNTIKAGPLVKVTVKSNNGNTEIPEENGYYALNAGTEYTVDLQGGSASNGYYVLFEISSNKTASNSLINTLFTPVYAESVLNCYAVKYPAENGENNFIKLTLDSSPKQLRISCVWANGDIQVNNTELTYGTKTYSLVDSNNSISLEPKKTSYTINLLNENDTPLKQSEVMACISTFSENTGEDQDAVISVEDAEETEITIPDIEGYELVSVNGEKPKESYLLAEGQENVFNAKYRKIGEPTEQNPEVTSGNNEEETSENKEVTVENSKSPESNNETVGGESANEKVTEQTDPAVESTEPTVDPVQIQETPVEQKTTNTVQEQPATEHQEQQQDESSVSVTGDDIPVSQSEDITMDDSTEVVDDVTDEIGQ